jgi:hypothetical protein
MKSLQHLCGLLLSSSCVSVFACGNPALTDIPDGVSGPEEQAVQDDMLRYLSEMREYVSCIQEDYEAAQKDGFPEVFLSLLATRNNAAVAELEAMRKVYVARIGPVEDLVARSGVGPDGSVDCIRVSKASLRYEVADNKTIVIYAGNEGTYKNTLEICPPVYPYTQISFFGLRDRVLTGICAGGFVGVESVRCKLGPFYPLTESEAEELLAD